MRLISFSVTIPQFRDGTKTVTRRLGWTNLVRGDLLCAVAKSPRALRGDETIETLGTIRVIDVRREPLRAITAEEVAREGFPEMTPSEFIALFLKANGLKSWQSSVEVARIEFEHTDIITVWKRGTL